MEKSKETIQKYKRQQQHKWPSQVSACELMCKNLSITNIWLVVHFNAQVTDACSKVLVNAPYCRKSWPYLERMDEILCKKPEIVPPAIACTSNGLQLREEEPDAPMSPAETAPHRAPQKRKSAQDDYLQEKLMLDKAKIEQLKRHNDLMEKFLDNMSGKL